MQSCSAKLRLAKAHAAKLRSVKLRQAQAGALNDDAAASGAAPATAAGQPAHAAQAQAQPDAAGAAALRALELALPGFFAAVGAFPDLRVEPGLTPDAIDALERRLDFPLAAGLKRLLGQCAAISMNGLALRASHFGPILMPGSEALVIGEFYLHNPGDRLLMLPGDEAVYYLEQRNGAITRLAEDVETFFNQVLPRCLYA